MSHVPLEFDHLFVVPEEISDEPLEDPVRKILETSLLGVSLQGRFEPAVVGFARAEKFEKACAQRSEALAAYWRNVARREEKEDALAKRLESPLAKTSTNLLAKRSGGERVEVTKRGKGKARIEKLIYPHGGVVFSQFDENGVCVKTWIEE